MTSAARRVAAALAASALLCGGLALSSGGAAAATPHPSHSATKAPAYKPRTSDAGLYGTTDPAHDGVSRQSLAMLGLYAANRRPANSAIRWLQAQQCTDGSFTSYRPEPGAPCSPDAPRDVDATALGMQALASVGGQKPRLDAALTWLRTQQNTDGGWGSAPGAPTNASTTSLVIGTVAMMGHRPSSVRSPYTDKQAYDALVGMALPCSVGHGAGGFSTTLPAPGQRPVADARASAEALLGGIGKRMVAAPVQPGPDPVCDAAGAGTPEGVARNGASYLAPLLSSEGAHLTTASGAADPAATADAVVAMCASGYGGRAAGALHWLEAHGDAWARKAGPAAYARLIFTAHTAGVDPARFGGVDLVKRLEAYGPPAAARPTPRPTGTAGASS
ncbi:prenyltransferase/squalene oxidase repeat-containing protein, partial [Streptomyces fuscigenes]|uniref:prenyltransferase/squalene oxidase repeat-containing protein n=1 Tax=Streptomyces fuscigenes TaxID=1528880 RepID=UPI001F16ECC5